MGAHLLVWDDANSTETHTHWTLKQFKSTNQQELKERRGRGEGDGENRTKTIKMAPEFHSGVKIPASVFYPIRKRKSLYFVCIFLLVLSYRLINRSELGNAGAKTTTGPSRLTVDETLTAGGWSAPALTLPAGAVPLPLRCSNRVAPVPPWCTPFWCTQWRRSW